MRHILKKKVSLPIFTVLLGLLSLVATGQDNEGTIWHDASLLTVHGKLDTVYTAPFQRFPMDMKDKVRERVWQLSKNAAGLYLDFKTDATDIIIQYEVEDKLAFPHMPATGVSGVDLYMSTPEQEWRWVRGNYNFGDTISYQFSGIDVDTIQSFRLYLPLYNTVKWMKIGISRYTELKAVALPEVKKPVIVYGTSIVQGACATRPGMAWPSILGRSLQRCVVNLGFSGNGRLEPEIIEFMTRTEASVYVLDCMANFTPGQGLNVEEAKKRLKSSVSNIRKKHPQTPILIAEHAGYSDGDIQPHRMQSYRELNVATQQVYNELLQEKTPNLYLLRHENLGLGIDGFVDGTHPNDHGMILYADAYLKKIDTIEKE
ncbi:SGNH/GDSL hydrolase family protein [Euzebyella saccharophila]|uniref:SGNH/GDSL hydrolase family protein n=1 Tax=Euzebyella saccharophila TaxID=679664 RepID=A0ABV8JND1_9FLAO|nr:SGNH/GDSL hydrolase family protein [Euzebyella saccharophila]